MSKEPNKQRNCKETGGGFVTVATQVRAELLRRWGLSVRQWSLLRGYDHRTVHRVIRGERGRRGRLSQAIQQRIRQDTGMEVAA